MDDQEEFEHQLALEQEEARKQEQGYIYTDPNDGTVYEWDDEKQAWFPRVDEDFLAAYHANYGMYPTQESDQTTATSITTNTATTTSATVTDKSVQPRLQQGKAKSAKDSGSATVEESLMRVQREAEQGIPAPVVDAKEVAAEEQQKPSKRKKEEPTWFNMDESKNTNVYVSGLPIENFSEEDFITLMSKCGIIMVEEETEAPKVKLYRDSEGNLKGDARCCYLKLESVKLAIQLLDDSEVEGKKIHVERAQFAMKGDFRPELKKKKKKPNKKKKGQKNFNPQEKLLDWRPEKSFQKKRFEQVVIIKHCFHPNEFDEDAMLINEIKDDLQAECSKYGEVKKVMIFDRHPDGVASVKFKDGDAAEVCVLALNGRWFAKRQLLAEVWDGKTDYKVEETDKERDERLKKWQDFLSDEKEEGQEKSTTAGKAGEEKTDTEASQDAEKSAKDIGGSQDSSKEVETSVGRKSKEDGKNVDRTDESKDSQSIAGKGEEGDAKETKESGS